LIAGASLACFAAAVHAAAIPTVEPGEFDFGEQSTGAASEERLFTVTNQGDADYRINAIGVLGAEVQFWISHDCTIGGGGETIGILTPSSSCTIRASFIPTQLGPTENNLIISGDVEPVLAVKLRGTGINGLSFLPPRLDFGAIGLRRKATLSSRVRNTTETDVRILDISTEDSHFALIGNTCTRNGSRLKAKASCKLTYRYRPLTEGEHNTTTTFDFEDSSFPSGELVLTGTVGSPPPPAIRSTAPLSPILAGVGDRVTLQGDGGFTARRGKILIGGKRAKIIAWTDKMAIFTVPPVPAADYFVTLVRRDGQSATTESLGNNNSYALPVKLPRIVSLNQIEGPPRSPLTLTGEFFGTAKPKVFFVRNDDPAGTRFAAKILKGNTSTEIQVRVPKRLTAGAYQVVVKNAAGESETSEATTFTVTP
jgi:hypothetical protein